MKAIKALFNFKNQKEIVMPIVTHKPPVLPAEVGFLAQLGWNIWKQERYGIFIYNNSAPGYNKIQINNDGFVILSREVNKSEHTSYFDVTNYPVIIFESTETEQIIATLGSNLPASILDNYNNNKISAAV
ncbi:MAG: hypothetical protein MUF50_02710 [Planctomycetes bacterium]|jgi:hypothetical protein|nr:hypothetical protein [Planctomycetota bacterium]